MRRKGFTLVELLIVIVVIGVLSTMMMLSSTEAVSSAKATTIISDLRNIKTAVLAWYTDNLNRVVFKDDCSIYDTAMQNKIPIYNFFDHNGTAKGYEEVEKYLSNGTAINFKRWSNGDNRSSYCIERGDRAGNVWLVGYVLSDSEKKSLSGKLANKAQSVGLYQGKPYDQVTSYYTDGIAVWMKVPMN